MPELTVVFEDETTAVVITPPEIVLVEVDSDSNNGIVEVITEGPRGPADLRPRPSDIAFNIFGDIGTNELLLRLELASAVTIIPSRCRASAETWPSSPATVQITLESNGINSQVANVVFMADSASFLFSNTLVLEPGILRVLSGESTFGLRDFSITLSGDR